MATPLPPNRTDSIAAALPAVTVLAALAYAAAAYFLLFSPMIAKLETGGSLDLSGQRERAATLQAYSKKLDASKAAFALLNPDLKNRVSQMVTTEPSAQELFVQADAIAAKNGMVLTSIDTNVGDKVGDDGRREVSASINVAGGSYVQLKSFLADLENALRITDVKSVVFTAGGSSYSITYRTYYDDGLTPHAVNGSSQPRL
ncbi:MAG: hypothetical protein RLZZ324_665 [Candidatus Parcubacteria bacterium]|jgi:Tfp pilus assembly protein PilO